MKTKTLVLSALLMAMALGGCVDDGTDSEATPQDLALAAALEDGITTADEREQLDFVVSDGRSHTLEEGPYGIDDALSVFVEIDLPQTEGGAAADPTTEPMVHLGLFLPLIPGCDWDAWLGTSADVGVIANNPEFPEECQVPILADVGPYYRTPGDELGTEGDVPATDRGSGRLGEFLISRFVPHGYGVAQVSVFGTGQSNHCFESFGTSEQLGVAGAVDWLGAQPFSNGNVGLIGRSYDGSTPWMAAANSASDALKTIVPISGLSGLGDLLTWNGASESRAVTFQNVVYRNFGIDSNEAATDAATQVSCPDYTTAAAQGGGAYATGDDPVQDQGQYWEERRFLPGALENYDGSVYLIHGLQDDNVDPHAGWRAELAMRANGNDVRNMWGQWYHNYPDRVSEHGIAYRNPSSGGFLSEPDPDAEPELVVLAHPNSIRMDWAQDLLEWFNFYLKGEGSAPELHAEVQELGGPWRIEPTWPPADANVRDIGLGEGEIRVVAEDGDQGTGPADDQTDDASTVNHLDLGVLSEAEDVLMGGFSTVTITATPTGPGGQIYVELRDGTDGSDFGLSYGIMDLRWTTGESTEVVPGEPMTFDIPFQVFDARIPAGHNLELLVHGTGNDYLPPAVADPVIVDLAASTLHLSTLDRDDSYYYYQPPVWWEEDVDGNVIGQVEDEVGEGNQTAASPTFK